MKPLPVVIAALIDGDRILLINRKKGDFVGLWGLPGGKIELGEHIHEAATREIREETNLAARFDELCGVVSEHLLENNNIIGNFLLFVCKLKSEELDFRIGEEGELKWFDINKIDGYKSKIIPSDYMMIKNMILSKGHNHFKSIIEKQGDDHILKEFEAVK